MGGNGGIMREIPLSYLKNYMKSTEHYLACGVSLAGHLAEICQRNPRNFLESKIWKIFVKTYLSLEPLHDADIQPYELLKLV